MLIGSSNCSVVASAVKPRRDATVPRPMHVVEAQRSGGVAFADLDDDLELRQPRGGKLAGHAAAEFRRQRVDHADVVAGLERGRGDERAAADLVERVFQLGQPIGRVDVDQHEAGLGGGELGDDPLGIVGRPDADAVARLEPSASRPAARRRRVRRTRHRSSGCPAGARSAPGRSPRRATVRAKLAPIVSPSSGRGVRTVDVAGNPVRHRHIPRLAPPWFAPQRGAMRLLARPLAGWADSAIMPHILFDIEGFSAMAIARQHAARAGLRPRRNGGHAARHGRRVRRRRDRAARRRDRPQQPVPDATCGARWASSGLLGITVEEEYGGAGMGYLAHVVAMEEISRASASVGLSYGAHSNLCVNQIRRNGNEAQKRKYLPKLIQRRACRRAGDERAGRGLRRGGDAPARRDKGDRYVLNGTQDVDHQRARRRHAGGLRQDRCRQPGRAASRPSWSRRACKGFSTAQKLDKLGMRGSNTCELVFEDCEVPEENVLGAESDAASTC